MKIPDNAIIPPQKLTNYLLVLRLRDDKSKYLAQAGFTDQNPDELVAALRQHASENEALEDKRDQYGIFYRVEGILQGVNGTNLDVITIWLHPTNQQVFSFITLKPNKKAKP